jgi:hypothetical protein
VIRHSCPAAAGLATLAFPLALAAQTADTASAGPRVTFGAFADAYYAYDAGRPATIDRAFTTQAARHNEFNVNLAFVEAKLEGAGVRGRLALQAGTSVQSNYAGEPTIGAVSGPTLARHIQEAVIGARIAPGLWVDGGIFLSHIGSESWISRDNPTYTRSLIAELSPYYQAGAKLTWQPSAAVTAQLDVVNGWQNVSENNGGKAAGVRVDVAASPALTVSVYNFVGDEQPDSLPSRVRAFQGASVRWAAGAATVVATGDVGWQAGADGDDGSTWYGLALIGRLQVTPAVGVAARVERYSDPDGVIVASGSPDGFVVNGGSVGLDLAPAPRLLWRTELRGLDATADIFPDDGAASDRDLVAVTSLAVTF